MSKLEREENPCPYMGSVIQNENGQIEIPNDSYKIAVGPLDVKNNIMRLSKVENFSYKEVDGKIYRIGENGVKYIPISRKKFEKEQKLHEEYLGNEEDDINR